MHLSKQVCTKSTFCTKFTDTVKQLDSHIFVNFGEIWNLSKMYFVCLAVAKKCNSVNYKAHFTPAVFLSLPWIPSNLLNSKQTFSSLATHQNVKSLRWQYFTRASNTCGGKIKGAWLASYENLAHVAPLLEVFECSSFGVEWRKERISKKGYEISLHTEMPQLIQLSLHVKKINLKF